MNAIQIGDSAFFFEEESPLSTAPLDGLLDEELTVATQISKSSSIDAAPVVAVDPVLVAAVVPEVVVQQQQQQQQDHPHEDDHVAVAAAFANLDEPQVQALPQHQEHYNYESLSDDDDDDDSIRSSSIEIIGFTPSRKRRRLERMMAVRLPLGTFAAADTIYRNRVHPDETFATGGHVHISELVLPETTTCLCTTFMRGTAEWYKQFMDTEHLEQFLVVSHDDRRAPEFRFVGDAELLPMFPHIESDHQQHQQHTTTTTTTTTTEETLDDEGEHAAQTERHERHRRAGWRWLLAKPRSGGSLHAKLLLFRNAHGLRVVVSGNNLHQAQWEMDRDCLWIQDFAVATDETPSIAGAGALGSFLKDLTQCRTETDQHIADRVLDSLFRRIDLSTATARLVFSFPRTTAGALQGGWIQLTRAVQCLLLEQQQQQQPEERSKTANDTGDDPDDDTSTSSSTLYAMAGSFGNLWPDFLMQMKMAMQGQLHSSTKPGRSLAAWDEVTGVQCLWPSCQTALSSYHLRAIAGCMRAMPLSHWRNIPPESRRRIFFDALPTAVSHPLLLQAEQDDGQPRHALAHGKVMLLETTKKHASSNDATGTTSAAAAAAAAVIYVGSHNFSQAAWGLNGTAPKNVEVGVVLATQSLSTIETWKARLPYQLPNPNQLAPDDYVPASCHDGIRQAMQGTGNAELAFAMLRHWLEKKGNAEREGGKVGTAIEIE